MIPPTSIDGTDITGATIDGTDVQEITVDGQTVFTAAGVIPNSGDLHSHHKFDELSSSTTSNVPDSSGNGHDLVNGSFTGVSTTINGIQAGEFNGTNDGIFSNTFSTISQPFTVFTVAELSGTGTGLRDRIVSLNSSTPGVLGFNTEQDLRWDGFLGSEIDGSTNTNVNLITWVVDGANSVIRETGGQTASGDLGSVNMDVVGVGFRVDDNSEFWEGAIGEVAIYPDRRSGSQIAQVESYLANKWNITI